MQSGGMTLQEAYGSGFERIVIWTMLHDSDYAQPLYSAIDSAIFENENYQIIFDAAKSASVASNGPVSIPVVAAELSRLRRAVKAKTPQYDSFANALKSLAKLVKKTYQAADVRYVKDSTAKFLTKSKLREALIKAGEHWERDEFDNALSVVETAVHDSVRSASSSLGISFDNPADRIKLYATKKAAVKNAPIDIPLLDKLMRGGLEPGALGLFLAPAKRGKSLALVQAGCAALTRGLNVACVTLELGSADYAMRFDAHFTGLPVNEISANPKQHAKSVFHTNFKKVRGRLFVQHYGADAVSVGDIHVWLKALQSQKKFAPDVILVDYIDLLRHSTQKGTRPDVGLTARSLRQLGEDFNCAVWSASQTNRASYPGKRITLQDVAEDIQKVHVADVIIGIAQTDKEKDRGRCRLILLANRQGGGEGKTVDCIVTTETMTLTQARTQATTIGAFNAP